MRIPNAIYHNALEEFLSVIKVFLQEALSKCLSELGVEDLMLFDETMVETLVKNFFKNRFDTISGEKVGVLVDEYLLRVSSHSKDLGLHNFQKLIGSVPRNARLSHDILYESIKNFLEKHPKFQDSQRMELSKYLDQEKMSASKIQDAIEHSKFVFQMGPHTRVYMAQKRKIEALEAQLKGKDSVSANFRNEDKEDSVSRRFSLDNSAHS